MTSIEKEELTKTYDCQECGRNLSRAEYHPYTYCVLQKAGQLDVWLQEIAALKQQHSREIAELNKSYGGCHNCYGKGYASYDGQYFAKGMRWQDDSARYCDCERGKQLQTLLEQQSKQQPPLDGGEPK